ncbi:hypothetical protein G9A89_008148 [Geosiphon pyriformis]|nr:hypothetical protein G9A89_008148 [Geosiphon pyriformis]
MAYVSITKLDNFTGKENDAQVWLNDVEKAIAANRWNDARAMQAIPYFLKDITNSCINRLVNTFTIMKQEETEAVTTYLERFHQNLHQIQAIDANYFTAPQILNQFIHGLCSSILQHVCLLHPDTLQDAVTHARDFESAESEANHAQAINLVMNGLSKLDSKLEKFSESINKRLEEYLADNYAIYQPPQRHNNQGNSNRAQNQPHLSSSTNQCDLLTTAATNNLSTPTNPNTTPKLTTQRNPKTENNSTELEIGNSSPSTDPHLLVTPEDTSANNPVFAQKQLLTSNISPATITEDEFLAAIFPFKFEETGAMTLFSGATLEAKPITAMYTDAKVEGQSIKLIFNSGLADTNGVTKTLIGKIDDFPFKVHSIVTPIKVLVMEATQYQALIVSWADEKHNKLLPILSWDDNDNGKGKQKEELIWETDDLTWTDNNKSKLTSSWDWKNNKEEKRKGKKKEEKNTQANNTYIPYTYGQQQPSTYCRPKLICVDCNKKLSSIGACCGDDEEYQMATKFYCCACHIKRFGRPKQMGK